ASESPVLPIASGSGALPGARPRRVGRADMLLQDLVVRIQTRQSISTRSPTLALANRPALRRTVAGVVPVNGSGARRGRAVRRERLLRRVTRPKNDAVLIQLRLT